MVQRRFLVIKTEKNKYESIVAIHPETSEDSLKGFFKQIREVIQNFEGSIHHIDNLGSRPLANLGQIKKVKSASYFHFSFEALPTCMKEIDRLFRISDLILYFHSERLDSRLSLDKHQEYFEKILKESKDREEQRKAYLKTKKKKSFGASTEAPRS